MSGMEDWSCSVPVRRDRRRTISPTEVGANEPRVVLLGAKSETIPFNLP